MTTSQLQAACKPLDYPFWFQLDDGSHVSCADVITLDGAAIMFVSGTEPRRLFLHQIKACVQHPTGHNDPDAAPDRGRINASGSS